MINSLLSFSNIIEGIEGVVEWVGSIVSKITGVFSDVDFSILYDWLPSDVQGVITAVIAVLLFLALLGLLKKLIVFLG